MGRIRQTEGITFVCIELDVEKYAFKNLWKLTWKTEGIQQKALCLRRLQQIFPNRSKCDFFIRIAENTMFNR